MTDFDIKKMVNIDGGLSNMDGSIDDGVEEDLKANPRTHYANYAGWNFYGYVFFDEIENLFKCEVWRFKTPVAVISSETLRGIMRDVSSEFGHD